MIDYNLTTYRTWLKENLRLADAFSPPSLRDITHHLLMGRNYRLLTEENTKQKLFTTYVWIKDVVESAKKAHGAKWRECLLEDLLKSKPAKSAEQKDLLYWLIGTTQKGAVNLGITPKDYPEVLAEMIRYCEILFKNIDRTEDIDDAWLFMMTGSATLTIRGSEKSKIGKQLEKVFLKALLTILGFQKDENFWMNIQRDKEVERESDAEIKTKRGRLRIEVGLIAQGNQEVVEDKIGRVGRHGVILFDKIGTRSRIHETAANAGVKLIQIRGNQPLTEVYRHIEPLVDIKVNEPPTLEADLRRLIDGLPDEIFRVAKSSRVDEASEEEGLTGSDKLAVQAPKSRKKQPNRAE